MKYVSSDTYKCQRSGRPFRGGSSSVDFCNKGFLLTPPLRRNPRAHTAPSLKTNVSENNAEVSKTTQVLFLFIFYPDNLALSPSVLTDGMGYITPPSSTGADLMARAHTETASPKSATPIAIGSKPHMTDVSSYRDTNTYLQPLQ